MIGHKILCNSENMLDCLQEKILFTISYQKFKTFRNFFKLTLKDALKIHA